MQPDRLVVIGTSFRSVGFERLARFVLPEDAGLAGEVARLRDGLGAREVVYVATCNRVELYLAFGPGERLEPGRLLARARELFALRDGGPVDEGALFAKVGKDALAHLFAVVSSLDSLVIGECEIAGQLRRALDRAEEKGLAGPELRRAFDRAQRVARRVRGETAIGRTPVSVASLCVRRVRERLSRHAAGADGGRPVAALFGAGEVVRKVAAGLQDGGIELLFVNRTLEKAQALADRFGGRAIGLEGFRAAPPSRLDVVVAATSAPGPVVGAAELAAARAAARGGRRLLVCDLGLPAQVDPALGGEADLEVVRLADLEEKARENRARLETEVAHATAIVKDEVDAAQAELHLRAVAEESVDAILEGRLAHLADEDRETVRRFAVRLAERLARQPQPR